MAKKSYSKRDTTADRTFGERYLIEEQSIELLISTRQDGNMDNRFSEDAKDNYDRFLKKHKLKVGESFCPALGKNYRIITIDELTEEQYAGKFIGYDDPREEYHCDAVIVIETSIPVAFRVGDCPVVLIAGQCPGGKTIMALVHAGRPELMAEMLKMTVDRMASSDYRMHLRSATAYVFPHICKYCYKLEYLDAATQEKANDFLEISNGFFYLNLMGWVKSQLSESGIQRIATAFFRCTAGISPVCESRLLHDIKSFKGLYSHFKSFHYKVPEGRFKVVARLIDKDEEDDGEEEFQET